MAAWRDLPGRLRWRLRSRLDRVLGALMARRGFDVIRRSPYSPVPSLPPPGSPEWGPKHTLAGLDLDAGRQLDWLRRELGPFLGELAAPLDRPAGGGFFLRNGYYGGIDALLLHAMVRRFRPRRIIEAGSGYSTWVMADACRRNAGQGAPCTLACVDPEPRIALPAGPVLEQKSAADLPLERFLALEAGDILFVDSSHTVKRGSEVNYLVLEALPRLAPGVIVHFHDIFLPYDYPREWFCRGTYLAEQYLLHAFLIANSGYEVLLAAHALFRGRPGALDAVLPGLAPGLLPPAALWLRRSRGRPE